jgi:8-oxo-dGTP diphosphatase
MTLITIMKGAFMKEVSAAIIIENKKVLICRRGEGGSCGNLWEFPGGKRESGETLEQCLVRECREELGISIKTEGVYHTTTFLYPEYTVILTFFHARIIDGQPKAIVHNEIRWVSLNELLHYNFCPADEEIIRLLQKAIL